jgi:hypothetical protein
MNVRNKGTSINVGLIGPPLTARTAVWPSRSYARQVATLQHRVGQPIYIVELTFNGLAVGAVFHGEPRVLLDVVAFPRPDPSNHVYPHMLVLDDGRGINLGRVARVTSSRAFAPDKTDVLYGNRALQHRFLYRAQRLTPRHIARIARQQLRVLLGRPMDKRLGRNRSAP